MSQPASGGAQVCLFYVGASWLPLWTVASQAPFDIEPQVKVDFYKYQNRVHIFASKTKNVILVRISCKSTHNRGLPILVRHLSFADTWTLLHGGSLVDVLHVIAHFPVVNPPLRDVIGATIRHMVPSLPCYILCWHADQ
ncbi:hypothetical protein B0H65DRAFT_75302 [Neurospora tetraspora]|uniref:Uncharacterized protein n=1 Tax=Neurospora tetraspora TaxID=94610 RepID=A0AAE0MJI5_9PEZI|nr:hypothetical protein B0H65DRAFT_75302 [Neurospora tetraspora]